MTPAQIRARLETASSRLVDLNSELQRKEALLRSGRDVNGDGTFDEGDQQEVERVRNRRDEAQNRVDGMLQRLMIAEAEAEGTPIEIMEFDEGELVVADGERRPFSQDRNGFKTQIGAWRTDVRESLGRMVNTMLDPDNPGPSFPKNEIVSLVQAALTASQPQLAAAIGVANTILDLAKNAYERTLPTTPSLRQIETTWRDAINAVTDAEAEAQFDELVRVFKAEHHIEADEDYLYSTYYSQWDDLIDGFRAGDVLPSSDSINRSFLSHIISEMPDSPWDMDWTAGEVKIYMEFDMDRNRFTFSSGSVDDITNEVKRALLADPDVFGENKVKSLPTPIRFNISGSDWDEGTFCEVYRRAATSGDTGFQLSPMPIGTDTTLEEQGTLFQIFMNRRIYDNVSVTQVVT